MKRTSLLLAVVIAAAGMLVGPSAAAQARPCDFYQDPVDCIYPPDPVPVPPLPVIPPPPTPPCTSLTDCVSEPSPSVSSQLVETMGVVASDVDGTTSQQLLLAGRTYTLVASGTFTESSSGAIADPECTATANDTTWRADRFGSAPDRLDLTVNGASLNWLPADTSTPCDEGTHVYTATVPVTTTTYLRGAVADTSHADNVGALKLTILLTGIGPVPYVPNPGPGTASSASSTWSRSTAGAPRARSPRSRSTRT